MAYPLEKRMSEEELQNIIQDYKNGLSITQLSRQYSYCQESLSKMLTRLGVKTKTGSDCIRKFHFNINKMIEDSSDKFYWLGFISGDGSVGTNEKRLRIEVKDNDVEILINFLEFIESNAIIHHRINNNESHCCHVDINSSKLLKYLENYNIHPCKTYDFEIPLDKIPNKYIWHFVRGLMDADGCICIRKNRKYNPYTVSFVAKNKKCVEQMKQIWNVDTKVNSNNGAYTIMKEGKGAIEILNNIYKDSSDKNRLSRKYAKYCSIVK